MFTENDDRTVKDFLKEYKKEAENFDITSIDLSGNEIDNYSNNKEFLAEVRDALDFTKTSTLEVLVDCKTLDTEAVSLFQNKEQYASAIAVLTNDFDPEWMKIVEATRGEKINPQYMAYAEYVSSIEAPLENKFIKESIEEEKNSKRTIADIIAKVEEIQVMKEEYGIENETIPKTLETILKMNEEQKAFVITREDYDNEKIIISIQDAEELHKEGYTSEDCKFLYNNENLTQGQAEAICILLKNFEIYGVNDKAVELAKEELKAKPYVEIVESIDGYVLNRDLTTPENYKTISEKTEEGNEIHYGGAVPKETTVDPALAHGKVQLEEVRDVGTIEEEKIEAGADLGILNEKHEGKKQKDFER